MGMLKLGQKIYKKEDERIVELYRILSTHNKEYYGVDCIIGDSTAKIMKRKVAEKEYTLANPHCKIFLEEITTNGKPDIIFSMYNVEDAYEYPYFTSRLRYGEDKLFKILKKSYICKREILKATDGDIKRYKFMYDDLMDGIGSKQKSTSIDLYLNDTLDTVANMIALNTNVGRIIYEYLVDKVEENITSPVEAIRVFLDRIKFMYYFHMNFNVMKVLFAVEDMKPLPPGDVFVLEAIVQEKFIDYVIVEYYHNINLDKIEGDHFFIVDKNNRTFVVKFYPASKLPGIVL